MKYISELNEKIQVVEDVFSPLIGEEISGYEIAQLGDEELQIWDNWLELPLFLNIGSKTISISWSKFEDLFLSEDRVLPYSICGEHIIRWTNEGNQVLESAIGNRIESVYLAPNEVSFGNYIEKIWPDLIIKFCDKSSLTIYNDLDKNGFKYSHEFNEDNLLKCI